MNYSRVFFMLLMVVVFGNLSVIPQVSKDSDKSDAKTEMFKIFTSPFRYIITYNKVRTWSNGEIVYEICDVDEEEGSRLIDVLMEKKSFTKENLIFLFRLISTSFPKPEFMNVSIFTDFRDMLTPEERGRSLMSELPDSEPTVYDGIHATLRRAECSSELKCRGIIWIYDVNGNIVHREDIVIEELDIVY